MDKNYTFWTLFIILLFNKAILLSANVWRNDGWVAINVDPDQTPHSATSDLGLYCSLWPVGVSKTIWLHRNPTNILLNLPLSVHRVVWSESSLGGFWIAKNAPKKKTDQTVLIRKPIWVRWAHIHLERFLTLRLMWWWRICYWTFNPISRILLTLLVCVDTVNPLRSCRARLVYLTKLYWICSVL